jgi:membrane protein DedA with SNARE-associated domain
MKIRKVLWLTLTIALTALVIDQLWTNYLSTELFFKTIFTIIILTFAVVFISIIVNKTSKKKKS